MKRSRGTYARLICLRCRARKVKCLLPDDDTLQPSAQPQPREKACQRCRQTGLDCVLDYTTLGRPSSQKRKRQGGGEGCTASSDGAESSRATGTVSPSPPADAFVLAQPEHDGLNRNRTRHQPSNKELYEALMSSVVLFTSLLRRNAHFASKVVSNRSAGAASKDLLSLLNARLCVELDRLLVWHRFYFPQLPTLMQLRDELHDQRDRVPNADSTILFALLALAALDTPPATTKALAPNRKHLEPILSGIVFEVGQQVLFNPTPKQHTVLALTLLAEYQPLGLIANRHAASGAILGRTYILCAKKAGSLLGLDIAHTKLQELIAANKQAAVEAAVLDCLLWCHLSMTEANVYIDADHPRRSLDHQDPAIKSSLEAVRSSLNAFLMPIAIVYSYLDLQATYNAWEAFTNIQNAHGHLDKIATIIDHHHASSNALKNYIRSHAAKLHHIGHPEQATTLLHLSITALQTHLVHVSGFAMFHAVIAASNPHHPSPPSSSPAHEPQGPSPDQAVQITSNMISSLQAHPASDPARPPLRLFLEKYGHDRMDQLQTCLTNFIKASELTLDGVSHVMPARSSTSHVLFVCKDIVEGNAARYKGWGGLHESTDTLLILFESCARALEGMSRGAGRGEAVEEGNLYAAGATLVRSLRRIMDGWGKRILAAEQLDFATGGDEGREGTEWLDDGFFEEWRSWPSFDALDLEQLFGVGCGMDSSL